MAKQAVATQAGTAVAQIEDMSVFDTGDRWFDDIRAKDLLIPRLTILQSSSYQVKPNRAEYIKEAKVGEIYDTGVQERFNGEETGIHFIPVHFKTHWLEWNGDRTATQKLVAVHDSEEIMKQTEKDQNGAFRLENGNIIAETMQFSGFNVTADFRKSFIAFASTQLKKGKLLLSLATGEKVKRKDGTQFTPPLYFRSYKLTSVPESNAKGDWMGWKVERGERVMDLGIPGLVDELKKFRESIIKGEVRADLDSMADDQGGAGRKDDDAF